MIKVSIIVPVYNAHNTLDRCLKSLMRQTLEDIEIICIDDCSTDDSWNILQNWEKKYPEKMIVATLPENKGPGGARNVALKYASGEYIGFCDSDDYIHSEMYKELYNEAKSGDYDFVDCGYLEEKDNKGILRTGEDCIGVLDDYKREKLIVSGGYLWSRIFKKELFDGIEFRENVILEDMEVLMLLILQSKKISILREIRYMYCYYEESSSRKNKGKNYHNALIEALDAIYIQIMPYKSYDKIQKAVEYAIIYLITLGVINSYDKSNDLSIEEREEMRKELRKMKHDMVKKPALENEYVMAKIPEIDRKFFDIL